MAKLVAVHLVDRRHLCRRLCPGFPRAMRTLAKWLVLLALPVLFALACVEGYYAWRKLTYVGYSCDSFAEVDDAIGWVLKPNATSCMGARPPSGDPAPYYHFVVHTDVNGFRAAQTGQPTPTGGVLAIGDSWTFGFGVDYHDSFPGQLAEQSGLPVVTVASPAYSSAQALVLGERWVGRLAPRAIVYLDNGFWNRAACRGPRRPTAILKPCYWQPAPGAEAELVLPPPGRVTSAAGWNNLPGGILGAGELGWGYFLIARPIAMVTQGLARVGLVPGFANDFLAVGVDERAIRLAALRHLARLATAAQAPVILVDTVNYYGDLLPELPAEQRARIHRIDQREMDGAIGEALRTLSPADAYVPHDGHYGPGMNRLIGLMLTEKLRNLGIAR